MNEPRISVILANYNHARFLPRCLDAMLNQPVLPWEIIIVDDGSTDNSREVIQAYAKKSPLIVGHANERNLGVCPTQNRGIALATGDYVVFPASDDEVKPGVFEQIIRMARAYPDAGVCSGMCEWRCSDTGLVWYVGGGMPKQLSFVSPDEMEVLARQGKLAIAGQAAAYKKEALVAAGAGCGGWVPELRWCADWFGAYVVGFRHGIAHVPEVLSVFNLSKTSYFHSGNRRERLRVIAHVLELLDSAAFADVAPRIYRSGMLGAFGWPLLRLMAADRRYRRGMNALTLRKAGRRCAEVAARQFFPNWLAKFCLKLTYGRSR